MVFTFNIPETCKCGVFKRFFFSRKTALMWIGLCASFCLPAETSAGDHAYKRIYAPYDYQRSYNYRRQRGELDRNRTAVPSVYGPYGPYAPYAPYAPYPQSLYYRPWYAYPPAYWTYRPGYLGYLSIYGPY